MNVMSRLHFTENLILITACILFLARSFDDLLAVDHV